MKNDLREYVKISYKDMLRTGWRPSWYMVPPACQMILEEAIQELMEEENNGVREKNEFRGIDTKEAYPTWVISPAAGPKGRHGES